MRLQPPSVASLALLTFLGSPRARAAKPAGPDNPTELELKNLAKKIHDSSPECVSNYKHQIDSAFGVSQPNEWLNVESRGFRSHEEAMKALHLLERAPVRSAADVQKFSTILATQSKKLKAENVFQSLVAADCPSLARHVLTSMLLAPAAQRRLSAVERGQAKKVAYRSATSPGEAPLNIYDLGAQINILRNIIDLSGTKIQSQTHAQIKRLADDARAKRKSFSAREESLHLDFESNSVSVEQARGYLKLREDEFSQLQTLRKRLNEIALAVKKQEPLLK